MGKEIEADTPRPSSKKHWTTGADRFELAKQYQKIRERCKRRFKKPYAGSQDRWPKNPRTHSRCGLRFEPSLARVFGMACLRADPDATHSGIQAHPWIPVFAGMTASLDVGTEET